MFTVNSKVGDYEVCLHDDTVADQTVKLIDPKLELEQNKAGTFTFTLAPNNIGYNEHTITTEMVDSIDSSGHITTKTVTTTVDLVSRMQSTITVFRDGVEIWEGRVLSEERDWYNRRKITCEGELAYLNDTCQQSKRYHDITLSNFVGVVLSLHNSKVDESKRFYPGVITVHNDAGDTGYYDTQYEKTMETINNLISDFGGILRIRKVDGKRYLDWLADYPNVSRQTINFGKNLLDFKCTWDMSSLCTVLLPTGAVIENAGADTIGEPMTPINDGGVPTSGQLLYLDENNVVQINDNAGLEGYKTAVYNITATDGINPTSVYISCRLHGGLVCFVAKSGAGGLGNQLGYITATQESGYEFKDYIDYKVTLPAGTRSFTVCSFGNDIPLTVKTNIPGTNTTVTGTVIQPDVGPNSGELLYLDEGIVKLTTDNVQSDYRVSTYYIESNAGALKTVYISCRLHGGFVAWVTKDATGGINEGSQLSFQVATEQSPASFQDFINQEVTLPAGTRELIVCSYGNDIPAKVMIDVEETTTNTDDAALDKYLTVEECETDSGWHTKGSPYVVYQALVEKYGWIEKGLALEEITDKNELYSTAKRYLQEGMFDEMTLELTAIDLKMLGVEPDYINLLDQVQAVSEPHNLNKLLPVTKLSMPLAKPAEFKYTLGTETTNSLTETNNEINEETLKKISIKSSETLTAAQRDAASLIGMATNGFITFINDDEGNPKELVISNTKDPTMCTNCWIWNVNGLGHADHYPLVPGDTVNVAMTMDGSIVADRITTGILTGILIRGISLVLGGMDSAPGTLLIKSSTPEDDFCVEGKNGGMYFGVLTAESDPTAQSPRGSYTVNEHGHIRGDITFQTDDGDDHGLAIDSKVIALECDELWVTTASHYSGGGTDAVKGIDILGGGSNTVWLPMGTDVNDLTYLAVEVRHGVITGLTTPIN